MKVTDLLVNCLENEKVEYVFGIVGSETTDLADSVSKSKQIQFINVRHEQGAAFMADVYGRLAKKAGVCCSTLGPGATNLLTGVSSAQLDHSPLVALIGQAGIERHHKESHQYIDIENIYKPVTKWTTQILDAQTVPTVIRKAFRCAQMEKPGSVAVILPESIATQSTSNEPLPLSPLPETIPSLDAIQAAVLLLQQYRKPFIIVGNGVIRQDAVSELRTFINMLQSPTAHSFMAKGVLAKEHPQNYFTFGFNENDGSLQGIKEADLLVVIGLDFVEKLPKDWNKNKLPILHIDTLAAEVNDYYPVSQELVGNIKKTLQLLNNGEIPAKPWIPSGNLQDQLKKSYQLLRDTPADAFTVETILHCIENLAPGNTIVISDVGAHKVSIARTFQPKMANRVIISNGFASMGIAIPGAIGAKLACPNVPVICITGDGGALMNFAEIETAKRFGLSFIVVILKDSMLKLEVQQMNKKFGDSYGVTFHNPDFVQLAESFGIKGAKARNVMNFERCLNLALRSEGEIVLIEAEL